MIFLLYLLYFLSLVLIIYFLLKKPKIPLDIYQTWHTKELPPKMQECVDLLKKENSEFTHHLYDDNDCHEFIRTNFDKDVLYAYEKLIPIAFKADLFRYCILYKKGGIYIDIKYKTINGFKLINLTDKNYYVLERPYENKNCSLEEELFFINMPNYYNIIFNRIIKSFWKNKKLGIYNALIVSEPNNNHLLQCINKIVENCKNEYYGYNPLYITGPGLLSEIVVGNDTNKYNNFELFFSQKGNLIINRQKAILEQYPEYRDEQSKYCKLPPYYILWNNKYVYNDIPFPL